MKPHPGKPHHRVLIVDDHPMTRDGLVHLIDREPDLKAAWVAETAAQALGVVSAHAPDLVLLDLTLPDKSGIELLKDIHALRPGVSCLVISMHDESLYAERALKAGARGYVSKQEGGARIMAAIRRVLGGEIHVSEKTSARIVASFSGRPSAREPIARLSDREFEIFQWLGEGLGTQEIADRLKISPKTVETHRVSIKTKLGLASVSELIAFAARWSQSQDSGGK